MAKFEIKVDTKGLKTLSKQLKGLNKKVNRRTAREVGDVTVREMKELISKGISPIQGKGRFPRYKPSYEEQIRKRKGKFKRKRIRPVNLELTGEFLNDLDFETRRSNTQGVTTIVGYMTPESRDKEDGHRKGANRQRKRPTIPIGRERFAKRIELKIQEVYENFLTKLINKL